MGDNVALVIIFGSMAFVGSIGVIASYFTEKLKLQKLEVTKQESGLEGLKDELRTLRQEIAQLRDTTTQYDMSVDKALNETQQRIAHVEGKLRGEYAPISPNSGVGDDQMKTSAGGL